MLKVKFTRNILLSFVCIFILTACGTAHVRTEKVTTDLHDYNFIYIDKVDVHSQEKSAASNKDLQKKMIEWEKFARTELESYVHKSRYELSKSKSENQLVTLFVNLDVDLVYGNRAARYFGGFGAGKGSVDSILTVVDPSTNDVKFHAVSESDLSMGAFGGDMQGVLKSNIKKLIQQYPKAP